MDNESGRGKPKKSGGGKLSRSEIVQTRLSPKLRFIAEVMARHQRRTLSSLIEGLIEEAAERYKLPLVLSEKAQTDVYLFGERKYKKVSAKEAADRIWSIEDADRFVGFALFLPDLLTPEEARVWQLIIDTPYFWQNFEINIETRTGEVVAKEEWPVVDQHGIIHAHLREYWPLLHEILEGRESVEKFKSIKMPKNKIVPKPDYYPYPIKKILPLKSLK